MQWILGIALNFYTHENCLICNPQTKICFNLNCRKSASDMYVREILCISKTKKTSFEISGKYKIFGFAKYCMWNHHRSCEIIDELIRFAYNILQAQKQSFNCSYKLYFIKIIQLVESGIWFYVVGVGWLVGSFNFTI